MLSPGELHGLCAMVPSFTTEDGGSIDARATIDVAALQSAVDQMIGDGVDVLATTGSFGEVYNLTEDEQRTLIEATVATVNRRVPLFVGCTSPNPRDALDRMRFIRDAGADGVLLGAPYYIPTTVDNAVQFFLDAADRYPDLAIMIYHNPTYHRVTLPVPAFRQLATRPNIVAMKDSHRAPPAFLNLMEIVGDRLRVFVNQGQLFPYALLGAAGCWSIGAWMGPWPLLELTDACAAADWERARRVALDLARDRPVNDLSWRESSLKLSINEAGYCSVGPLRPPFGHVPPEIAEAARLRGQRWREMAEPYRLARASAVAR